MQGVQLQNKAEHADQRLDRPEHICRLWGKLAGGLAGGPSSGPGANAAGPSASAGLLWDRGSAERAPAQHLDKLLSWQLVVLLLNCLSSLSLGPVLQVHPHLQGCWCTGAPQKQVLHRLHQIVKLETGCSSAELPVKPEPATSAAGRSASAGLLWGRGSAERAPVQAATNCQAGNLLFC